MATQKHPIWVSDRLKAMVAPLQGILDALEATLDDAVCGELSDYADVEQAYAQCAASIEKTAHQITLSNLDVDSEFIRVWGAIHKRVGRYEGEYRCLAGPVRAMRSLYRKVGERNGATIDPISLRAGVVADGWLPRTARAMAHLMAKGTSREAEGTSVELTRLPYSRSSFERVGHAVGALYRAADERIEAALIEAYELPAEARSLSVALDRVSLAMEEPVPKPIVNPDTERAKWLEEEIAKLPKRFDVDARFQARPDYEIAQGKKHPPKVLRNFRMAYCATLTIHDAQGKSLHTIRYGRMPKGHVPSFMRGIARDVKALLAKRPEMKVSYLADGAVELWTLFDSHLNKREIGVDALRLVDFWHLTEYLWPASHVLENHQKSWPGTCDRWKAALLNQPLAAQTILDELRQSGLEKVRYEMKQPVGDAVRYMEKRLHLMNYAQARSQGMPVGSGQVEATCKSLVALRMKRPGARWKHISGEEILQLRALMLSDRWEAGMKRTMSPLRKPVKALTR